MLAAKCQQMLSKRRCYIAIGSVGSICYIIIFVGWFFMGYSPFSIGQDRNTLDADRYPERLIELWLQRRQISNSSNLVYLKPVRDATDEFYSQEALKFFFGTKMDTDDRNNLLETTQICLAILDKLKIPYFLYGGSLIGFHRHNSSLVPVS